MKNDVVAAAAKVHTHTGFRRTLTCAVFETRSACRRQSSGDLLRSGRARVVRSGRPLVGPSFRRGEWEGLAQGSFVVSRLDRRDRWDEGDGDYHLGELAGLRLDLDGAAVLADDVAGHRKA